MVTISISFSYLLALYLTVDTHTVLNLLTINTSEFVYVWLIWLFFRGIWSEWKDCYLLEPIQTLETTQDGHLWWSDISSKTSKSEIEPKHVYCLLFQKLKIDRYICFLQMIIKCHRKKWWLKNLYNYLLLLNLLWILLKHEACQHGHVEIAAKLLSAGALVDVPGTENETPLHDAVRHLKTDCVTLLVRHGASINTRLHISYVYKYNKNYNLVLSLILLCGMVKVLFLFLNIISYFNEKY